jgi:hypothetical protein
VLRRAEKEWALAIGPDTVRMLVLKAKAVSAAVNDDYADGNEHEVEFDGDRRDTHHHDGLAEEEASDFTAIELRDLIDDLNEDEAAELIALALIGRGDFDGAEWTEAVSEARQRRNGKTSKYLMGMPMLGDWLEEGLEAIGA